jgi:hypothetical protein
MIPTNRSAVARARSVPFRRIPNASQPLGQSSAIRATHAQSTSSGVKIDSRFRGLASRGLSSLSPGLHHDGSNGALLEFCVESCHNHVWAVRIWTLDAEEASFRQDSHSQQVSFCCQLATRPLHCTSPGERLPAVSSERLESSASGRLRCTAKLTRMHYMYRWSVMDLNDSAYRLDCYLIN